MTRPIAWDPKTMTKHEHREEALRLLETARRPQPQDHRPRLSSAAVTQMLLGAQIHLSLSADPATPDERPQSRQPRPEGRATHIMTTPEGMSWNMPQDPAIRWQTALGWTIRWTVDTWEVVTNRGERVWVTMNDLDRMLDGGHYPITGYTPIPGENGPTVLHDGELDRLRHDEDQMWETARGLKIQWNDSRQMFATTGTDGVFGAYWTHRDLARFLAPVEYPIRLIPAEEDIVDAQVEEDQETAEYKAGWRDAWTMRTLHDRIPGFAIVRPREADPFKANEAVLYEYGITSIPAMYAVAHAPHAAPEAHPRKVNPGPLRPEA